MNIRNFRPGDESVQVALYNEAAGQLAKFKPASEQEVQRRVRARDFDPASRFYSEENGRVVAYANYNPNGRVSYPWAAPGFEHVAKPLFEHMLQQMAAKGHRKIFAAYRADWPVVLEFFKQQGFRHARDMVNFVLDFLEMPTPSAVPSSAIAPLKPEDVPAVFAMMPESLRVSSALELRKHLFQNPYFTADSVFQLRSRSGEAPVAVGILITESTYASPKAIDSSMPCYRLGAFGTEGMSTKRVKGLFSFLAKPDQNVNAVGLDLMGQAAYRVRENDDIECLAAQVPSDVPSLLGFYERYFRKQGSFPVLEKELDS